MRVAAAVVAAAVAVGPSAVAAAPVQAQGPMSVADERMIAGRVRSADGDALPGIDVSVESVMGATLASTTTGRSGSFRLPGAVDAMRLVFRTGTFGPVLPGLPGWFRWEVPSRVAGGQRLQVTLPPTYLTSVAATDGRGRPLPAASVLSGGATAMTAGALWPEGPPAAGRQDVAPHPVLTGPDGRADLRAFATPDVGALRVTGAAPGATSSPTISSLAVAADQVVATIPARPTCAPRRANDIGPGQVRLVADLDEVTVRRSASRAALLHTADAIVSGAVPAVAYNATLTGDPRRYLYDEGVALRRVAGILGYAYAATKNTAYLDAMAEKVALNAARWPDWNPGHPLDTAQLATAVALAYAWSGRRLDAAEQAEVTDALASRMVLAYSCSDGLLAPTRTLTGNTNSVIATAATLAGLATRNAAPGWGSVAVADGTSALRRVSLADGTGRSVAGGPTVEGFMYTNYEAANLALLHATAGRNTTDPAVTEALADSVADLDRLAGWNERCGTVADPAMEDAWEVYPWVDRTTALAAMTAWPSAGGHVLDLLAQLQAGHTLTIPERGTWTVPDGIAELIVSASTPRSTPAPTVGSYASGPGPDGPYWGCATNGSLRAVIGAAPNDAPHAHRDVGNVVVRYGDQEVRADLGQRDYALTGVANGWRRLTMAHTTVGVLRRDGRVTQTDGAGTVAAVDGGLSMVSTSVLPDVDWRRGLALTPTGVAVRDEFSLRPGAARPTLSLSFLLPTPPGRVRDLGAGRLRFTLADGSAWQLMAPAGTAPTYRDANPTAPYDDTEEFKTTIGPAHTLVTVSVGLDSSLDLTTTVGRIGP